MIILLTQVIAALRNDLPAIMALAAMTQPVSSQPYAPIVLPPAIDTADSDHDEEMGSGQDS